MGCKNCNCNQSNITSPSPCILWTTYLLLSSHLMNKLPLPNEVLHSLFHFRLLHNLFHFTFFSIFLPSSTDCSVLQNFKLIVVYSFSFWIFQVAKYILNDSSDFRCSSDSDSDSDEGSGFILWAYPGMFLL